MVSSDHLTSRFLQVPQRASGVISLLAFCLCDHPDFHPLSFFLLSFVVNATIFLIFFCFLNLAAAPFTLVASTLLQLDCDASQATADEAV